MKHRKEENTYCARCGCRLPNPALAGAKCNTCILVQKDQYAAQRLAGTLPPKGFSV